MFVKKGPNPKKALKFEAKGDRLSAKGKYRKALLIYEKSQQKNPDNPDIYKKLCETLNKFEHEWTEEDFSKSMTWTMKEQELENPQMKLVHEKFTVEYMEVQKLVQKLMLAPNKELETRFINKIITYGDKAQLPVLDFLLSLKNIASQEIPGEEPPAGSPEQPTDSQ